MKKKMLSILLASAMTVSLAACGGSDGGSESGDGGSYDQVTYAYATFNNIPSEEALDEVEEAINQITRDKIGAEITLKPIAIADYSSSVSLSLQAGEKLDVFQSIGDFGNAVNTSMAADITELAEEYAKEAKETIGDAWLDACVVDGKLYGIPTLKPLAITPMVIYRQDIADEINLDMSSVESIEDLTAVLEQVKEAYPDMTPIIPVQPGDMGINRTYGEVDYLSDSYDMPIGVLLDGELTVLDLYSTDIFKERCEMVRNWYLNDLSMKDAATTTSLAAELMSSGNSFCYVAGYSYPEEDTAASLEAQCGGYDIGAKIIGDAYLGTGDINLLSWMISSNSDVPEAAMKFLNLTFTDADIINLLIYGIEGKDYVLDDEGYAAYPEGEDATTVHYTAQLSCGTLGNYFLMYPLIGADKASLEWELEQNKTAATSPAMGFSVDTSSLKTQYTAVQNVINQYLPGLTCGSVDPETEIPKFISALNDAGYQDILAAKQEQLDAWANQ